MKEKEVELSNTSQALTLPATVTFHWVFSVFMQGRGILIKSAYVVKLKKKKKSALPKNSNLYSQNAEKHFLGSFVQRRGYLSRLFAALSRAAW